MLKAQKNHHCCPRLIPGPPGPAGLTGVPGPRGLPGPSFAPKTSTQMVYVQKTAATSSPDGTLANPYTSVAAAMASITDANPNKRYSIYVFPGRYTEALLHIKPNVFIVGESVLTVRLDFSWDLNESGWNQNTGFDNRTGFDSVSLIGLSNVANFATQSSGAGKIYFYNTRCNLPITLIGFSNINQSFWDGVTLFSGLNITGLNNTFANMTILAGTLSITSMPGVTTILSILGGSTAGPVTFQYIVGDDPILALWLNWAMNSVLTLNGTGITLETNSSALPNASNITLLGGATLAQIQPYN